jgi:U3 small nucleolar ribonucleoprotein component
MDSQLLAYDFVEKSSEKSVNFLDVSRIYFKEMESKELDELYTKGFDLNQIWEQIQLVNSQNIKIISTKLKEQEELGPRTSKEIGMGYEGSEMDSEISNEDSAGYSGEEDSEDSDARESQQENSKEEMEELEKEYTEDLSDENPTVSKKPKKKSVVDDDFFSLEEMEKFADMAEKQDHKMLKKFNEKKMDDLESESDQDPEDMFSIGKEIATGEFDFNDEDDDDNANGIIVLIRYQLC